MSPTTKKSHGYQWHEAWCKERGSRKVISKDAWYAACVTKNSMEAFKRMSMAAFLQSVESAGTKSQQISFSKYLKQYGENGELKPASKKQTRESKFKAVEDKLVHYIIRLGQSLYQCDKCGFSWIIMQKKLVHWAALEEDEVYKNFEASPGFISWVLRDHNLIGVSFHGEANDMDDEERGTNHVTMKRKVSEKAS
jgi:hypothetical protein